MFLDDYIEWLFCDVGNEVTVTLLGWYAGAMKHAKKAGGAAQVLTMAPTDHLNVNEMLNELLQKGSKAKKKKHQEFLDLSERFRSATDQKEKARLGQQMGRMVFGK